MSSSGLHLDVKQSILAAMCVVALILMFPALSTPAVSSSFETSSANGSVTTTRAGIDGIWACSSTQVDSAERITTCSNARLACKGHEDIRRAYIGFGVLTILPNGLAAIFSVAKAVRPDLNVGTAKWVNIGLVGAAVVFGLIAWAACFAFASAKFCGIAFTDFPINTVGPAGPLLLVAWLLLTVQLVLEFVFAAGSGAGGHGHNAAIGSGDDIPPPAGGYPPPAAVLA